MVHCSISTVGYFGAFSLTRKSQPIPPPIIAKPLHFSGLSSTLFAATKYVQMETTSETIRDESNGQNPLSSPMSKNARKKLIKQQRYEEKKAEKKAQVKEHKKKEAERKRKEWGEKLAGLGEEEREKLIEDRKGMRKERMEKRTEERGRKMERLGEARISGQNVVIDLEFAHLMTSAELHSLVQQIMYCYAINGRCASPAHLWLTGCQGEMENELQRIPGYDKWLIEKECQSYVEAFLDQKENLVYLTADSENVLAELDSKSIYIIGGLVDRNRWKSITMNKAKEQGIKTAKLPIGNYLKMCSSQVLTVNQVVEILLKYLETKDWKDSFFHVIPQRKRCEAGSEENEEELVERERTGEDENKKRTEILPEEDDQKIKRRCIETGEDENLKRTEMLEEDDQKITRHCIETQTAVL